MPPRQVRPVATVRKHLTVLNYGWPGSGKTPLIGTCSGKVLIGECDPDGTSSLMGVDKARFDVWEIYSRTDMDEFCDYVRREAGSEYDWVWVDSLSGLDGRIMSDVLATAAAANPRQNAYVPDKPHYQVTQNFIHEHIKWLLEAPVHLGVTAHVMIQNRIELDEGGEEERLPMYMPQIQGGEGKLAQKIAGYFSIVGFVETRVHQGSEKQVMLVKQDTTHMARDRYMVLAPATGIVYEPNMAEIERKVMAKINGTGGPKKATAAKKVAKKVTKATKKGGKA